MLRLSGQFDLTGSARFEQAAADLPSAEQITIDLSELDFIDSSGLHALMKVELTSRSQGSALTLRAPRPHVLRVLRLCGLDERAEITLA